MSAPFVIPFNFSPPVSPSVKTTSYTVPTGRYAQVKVYFEGTETQTANTTTVLNNRTITLNGVTVLVPSSQAFTGSFTGLSTFTFTFPRVGLLTVTAVASANAASTITIGSYSYSLATATTQYTFYGSSSSIVIQVANTVTGSYNVTSKFDVPLDSTFWAKAGDVITGTGNWRALVTEYNQIS